MFEPIEPRGRLKGVMCLNSRWGREERAGVALPTSVPFDPFKRRAPNAGDSAGLETVDHCRTKELFGGTHNSFKQNVLDERNVQSVSPTVSRTTLFTTGLYQPRALYLRASP